MSVSVFGLLATACSNSKTATGTGGTGSGGNRPDGSATGSGGSGIGTGGNGTTSTGGTAPSSGGSGVSPGSGGQAGGGTTSGTGGTAAGGSAGNAGGGAGAGGTAPVVVACQAPSTATGTAATVTVNVAATPLATVGPDFMGVHTSVYDGSMQNAATPALLKAAGVTSLRYPGGSYGDSYHWETNTGSMTRSDNSNSAVYVAPNTDFGHFVALLENTGANAMITVNYGVNPAGTGPGVPQEAAAWVAYANGLPTSTTVIGVDSTGQDWSTVGYWAGLRASDPLAVDDGQNFLRISHPAPVGIKYWEVGNELYGNGYYYGGCGWETDWHAPYSPLPGPCAARQGNAALSPAVYGMGVKAFAAAIKAADPNAKVGAIVHWPYGEYADWNGAVLPLACASVDFVVNHWYAGTTLDSMLTIAHTAIPAMYHDLRVALTTASNNCGAKGMTMPIGLTEWGPNTLASQAPEIAAALTPAAPGIPTHTQFPGVFAAETYANLMEQGALTADWLELHSLTYLSSDDVPSWGYHGAYMATALAGAGDALLPVTSANVAILPHASRHADGSVNVMLTNTSATVTAAVTVTVTGGTSFACVGSRTLYAPVATFEDGPVVTTPIFASESGGSVAVTVPPYSVVVVAFPKR